VPDEVPVVELEPETLPEGEGDLVELAVPVLVAVGLPVPEDEGVEVEVPVTDVDTVVLTVGLEEAVEDAVAVEEGVEMVVQPPRPAFSVWSQLKPRLQTH
jgi:hypothetical protein